MLDFDMHQTGHQPEGAIDNMAQQIRAAYEAQPVMPVIAGESSYEGLDLREWGGGVLSSDASRQMFWVGPDAKWCRWRHVRGQRHLASESARHALWTVPARQKLGKYPLG